MHVEVAIAKYANRGHMVPLRNLNGGFYRKYHDRPMWRSYFVFGEESVAYAKRAGTMDSSYPEAVYVDSIRLDYEVQGDTAGEDSERVLAELRHIIRHLTRDLDVDYSWIRTWFSGRRGFHLEIPDLFNIAPSPELPHILKESLAHLIGHPMLDLKPVFTAGLLRLPWSQHPATGLHKIPLLTTEVFKLSMEEIKALAADPLVSRKGFAFPPAEDRRPVWAKEVKTTKRRLSFGTSKEGIEIKYNPTRVVTCMQNLLQRGPQKGSRNQDLLRLSAWMWRGGIPLEMAQGALVPWVMNSEDPAPEERYAKTISRTYESGYLYSCKDEIMRQFCSPRCIYFGNKDYAVHVDNTKSLAEIYRDYIAKVKGQNIGIDLHQLFPKWEGEYKWVPGEVVMITGDTGMAKTMLAQNIVIKARMETLWLNLEMSDHLNFRRFIQINEGWTKEEVATFFAEASEEEISEVVERASFIKQVSIAPTLGAIEQMIVQRDPSVLVVDTTDSIETGMAPGSTGHLRTIMERLRVIAQRYQIIIIGIHHITKSGSKEITAGVQTWRGPVKRSINLNDLTGDRSNVTKVDHVFAVEGSREEAERTLKSLKTRDGEPIAIQFRVDWDTFRWHTLA